MRGKYKDFSYTPCPPNAHTSHDQHPCKSGIFVTTDEPVSGHHSHLKSIADLRGSLLTSSILSLDKCRTPCIHHYGTAQTIFTALRVLCALPARPSSLSQPLATTDLFTVSVVSPFPECHVVGTVTRHLFGWASFI